MKTLMQQQIIIEGEMNSVFGMKKVSNLNSKPVDRKYHVQKQAPQGLIAANLPPPAKSRIFTYFIIYVLFVSRFSFPAFISGNNL